MTTPAKVHLESKKMKQIGLCVLMLSVHGQMWSVEIRRFGVTQKVEVAEAPKRSRLFKSARWMIRLSDSCNASIARCPRILEMQMG